jgi:hypothetical protein
MFCIGNSIEKRDIPASSCSSPVAMMLLWDLLQHPTRPGKADRVEKRKDTMNRATTERAMSGTQVTH